MTNFPCEKCGECCKRAGKVFPDWPVRDDGSCVHLNENNLCDIYETRPDVCRVDRLYDILKADDPGLPSRNEYYKYNKDVCQALRMLREEEILE